MWPFRKKSEEELADIRHMKKLGCVFAHGIWMKGGCGYSTPSAQKRGYDQIAKAVEIVEAQMKINKEEAEK